MSMTETPAEKPTAPKKKRKARKAAAKPRAPKQTAGVAFPGLTESECAAACTAFHCAISGTGICAHPRKGGLQAGDTAALQRLHKAQKQLGMNAVEKRFG